MSESTSSPFPVRLIVEDEPGSGAWNMAVDAVLLDSALRHGTCTVRWYRWREPTLSLGYFQSPEDPVIDERFSRLPLVRRLSGGGAILHDQELTYSCALSARHPLAMTPTVLYASIHAAIGASLGEHGVNVAARGSANRELDASFLCFSRGDANDLVINNHKVLGSAQRRRRGAVLQHGSLLLQRSPVAPEYPGITDLTGITLSPEMQTRLHQRTAGVIGTYHHPGVLTNSEVDRARELARQSLSSSQPSAAP